MRKIALIAVVAFAAACGSSTTDPVVSTGSIRFANLSPTINAIDFCIKPTGGTYSPPIMNALGGGGAAGLVYGGFGDKMVSKYVSYDAGTYVVAVLNKNVVGASCATSPLTLNVTIGANTKTLVALVGDDSVTGYAPTLTSYVDAVAADATRVTIRFINTGFYAHLMPVPPFDVGYNTNLAGSVYTPILTSIAYPGAATGPTGVVNGYALVNPALITAPATTVYTCQAGTNPSITGACQTLTLPGGSSSIVAGVVATAFVIGDALSLPNGLFCGDNTPQVPATWPYTMCVSNAVP